MQSIMPRKHGLAINDNRRRSAERSQVLIKVKVVTTSTF